MEAIEFHDALWKIWGHGPLSRNPITSQHTPVMVRHNETGAMFTVKAVELETHEEADGSHTIWIKVEDY